MTVFSPFPPSSVTPLIGVLAAVMSFLFHGFVLLKTRD